MAMSKEEFLECLPDPVRDADESDKLNFRMVFNMAVPEDYKKAEWGEIHESRSKLKTALDQVITRAQNQNRDLTDKEEKAFTYGITVLDELNKEFDVRQKHGTKSPVLLADRIVNPIYSPEYSIEKPSARKGYSKNKEYRSLFGYTHDTGGFKSLAELLSVDVSGRFDPRIQELQQRAWNEGTGAQGGFTVPQGFYESIWNTAIEDSVMLNRCQAFPMTSAQLIIPAFSNEARSTDGLYGGLVPAWIGEAQTATEVTGKVRYLTLTAHKLALYTSLSMEVASDSIALEQAVASALSKSLNYYADYYLFQGNGVAKPLGSLNDPALIKITRTGANTFVYTDVVNMYSRLAPSCVRNAVWCISPSVVPQLASMEDTGNHLIWTPNPVYGGAISGALPNSLLGLPVIVTEKLPSLGSEGDVLLADFSNYAYGTTGSMILEKSNAPGWSEGLISYRAIIRLDGMGLWQDPITPLNGGNTLSWAVCLS
jgi:HK97 family phage major capsid protein